MGLGVVHMEAGDMEAGMLDPRELEVQVVVRCLIQNKNMGLHFFILRPKTCFPIFLLLQVFSNSDDGLINKKLPKELLLR